MNIISKLDDEPNDHQGLTPAQLKARFDMAGNAIKAYLNGTLLPEMERAIDHIDTSGFVPAERTVCGKPLSEDITLTAHDVGALPAETPIPSALADLNEDSMHRTVTDAEKAAWNAKSNLALGETSTTAYRGDRGKIAYDHSRATGNPHGATPADIGAAPAVHTHGNLSVNGKALTGDVTLSPADIGAAEAAHTHEQADINGLSSALAGKADAGHTHAQSDVAGLAAALAGKADAVHTHENLSVNGKALTGDVTLSPADIGAAEAAHTHEQADINGLSSALAGKADAGHTHAQSDVAGLAATLAGKAEAAHTHTASEVAGLDQLLAGAVKIETGTYIGTGAYGETRPNSLTFSFEPKFVFVGCAFKTSAPYFPARVIGTFMVRPCMVSSNILSIQTYSITTATYNFVTWSGNTVSWHCRPDVNQQMAAGVQLNESEVEYHYFAIG